MALKMRLDPTKKEIVVWVDRVLYKAFKELLKLKFKRKGDNRKFSLIRLSKYCENAMRNYVNAIESAGEKELEHPAVEEKGDERL